MVAPRPPPPPRPPLLLPLLLLLFASAPAAVRGDFLMTTSWLGPWCGDGRGPYSVGFGGTPSPSRQPQPAPKPVLNSVWTFGCAKTSATASQQYRCFNSTHWQVLNWAASTVCAGAASSTGAVLQIAPMAGFPPAVTIPQITTPSSTPAPYSANPALACLAIASTGYSQTAQCVAGAAYVPAGVGRATFYEYSGGSAPMLSSSAGFQCMGGAGVGNTYLYDIMQPGFEGSCIPLMPNPIDSVVSLASVSYTCGANMSFQYWNTSNSCAGPPLTYPAPYYGGPTCFAQPQGADLGMQQVRAGTRGCCPPAPACGQPPPPIHLSLPSLPPRAQFVTNQCAWSGAQTLSVTPGPTTTSSPLPAPSYEFAQPVTVTVPAGQSQYLQATYTTESGASPDETMQLTLRVTFASLTGLPVSAVLIQQPPVYFVGATTATTTYTVLINANSQQGPTTGMQLQALTNSALSSVAAALSATLIGSVELSDITVALVPSQLSVACITAFSYGRCNMPVPFSASPSVAASLVPFPAPSAVPPVIIGLVGALLSLAFVLAAFVLHRKSRMTKLASAAQAQQTTMMGNLGGAIPVAPPATFSFAGAAGNPLAKQQLTKAMSAGRGSMSVRTVRVVAKEAAAADD